MRMAYRHHLMPYSDVDPTVLAEDTRCAFNPGSQSAGSSRYSGRVARILLVLLVALVCIVGCDATRTGTDPGATAVLAASTATASSSPPVAPATGTELPAEVYPAPYAAPVAPETMPATVVVGSAPQATVVPDATIALTIGNHRLEVDVVATPEKRSIGLMFQDTLPDDRGMLFVFAGPYTGSFWMHNTRIPLSIAFIDAERRILNIEDMQPLDEITQHFPAGAAQYALEVNQGWFAARGIQPGDVVMFELPPGLAIR